MTDEQIIKANAVSDLINRQAAEIEELKTEIERMENQNTLLLKKKCKDINTARKIIKSNAIKEFAERLKERYEKHILCSTNILNNEIDNLVKEMTEKEDES